MLDESGAVDGLIQSRLVIDAVSTDARHLSWPVLVLHPLRL